MKSHLTTRRGASRYVTARQPFHISNRQLYGEWVTPGRYVVYSYGPHWPLYVWSDATGWLRNEDKYSLTTTRHLSCACPDAPTNPVSHARIKQAALDA